MLFAKVELHNFKIRRSQQCSQLRTESPRLAKHVARFIYLSAPPMCNIHTLQKSYGVRTMSYSAWKLAQQVPIVAKSCGPLRSPELRLGSAMTWRHLSTRGGAARWKLTLITWKSNELLSGSFSAISTPIFASKYSLELGSSLKKRLRRRGHRWKIR